MRALARSASTTTSSVSDSSVVLGNEIHIAKEGLDPCLRNQLLRLAAFQNPEFYKAQVMRLSTYDKPRVIACAEDHPRHIGLPRGCLDDIHQMLTDVGVRAVVRDERCGGRRLGVQFHGELRREQKTAAEAMLAHDTGVLGATTAFGKTVVAAWLIAERGVNTLVLVHAAARSVDRAPLSLPRHRAKVDRSNRRRQIHTHRAHRCWHHSESGQERRC